MEEAFSMKYVCGADSRESSSTDKTDSISTELIVPIAVSELYYAFSTGFAWREDIG
jgi:hypothetical protein